MRTKWIYSFVTTLSLVANAGAVDALAPSKPAFVGRLPCVDAATTLRRGTFIVPVGRVRLVDGEACIRPYPAYSHCEWGVTLIRAQSWGANGQYFVAVIEANHDGPGTWDSVLMYRCNSGVYESVFAESYGPRGGKLVLGVGSSFEVITGEWLPKDPGCCPSHERTNTYTWDDSHHVFALVGSNVTILNRSIEPPNSQLEPTPRWR